MLDFEKEKAILDIRNKIHRELKLFTMGYTDFNRQVVIENENGEEELIPVKEITYEAKPNTCKGATETIIKDYTEKLGWEHVCNYKQAWVNGYILHHVYFKLD